MTVEEGSILDCKHSAANYKCRPDADAPPSALWLDWEIKPPGVLSRFGKLDGVAGQGCCWRNSSATFCDKSTVRASFDAHIEVKSLESMNVEIGLELMILQCL